MGLLARIARSLHRPCPPDAAESGPERTAAVGPDSPFDHWTAILLADRHVLIITGGDIFERISPRNWLVYTNNQWLQFDEDRVPHLVNWLEDQTVQVYYRALTERLK